MELCVRWARHLTARLLLRLGLRAGEVAGLELDSIDWRAGEIVVEGKSRRPERLPLPVDVGEAIAAYLRDGRPRVTGRGVFLQARAPHGALSRYGVRSVVYSACDRCGVPRFGPHRLRHTLGTNFEAGNDIAVIGLFLGHEKLEPTQHTATWRSKSAPSAAPQRCAVIGNTATAHPTRCLPSSRASDYAAWISSVSSSNRRDALHAA